MTSSSTNLAAAIVMFVVSVALMGCADTDFEPEAGKTEPASQPRDVPPDPDVVRNSIVRIVGFGCGAPALGSGFAVTEHLIVTSGHLVTGRDPETLAVSRPDGLEFSADLVAFDEDLDLAFLRVGDASFEPVELAQEVPDGSGVAIGLRTELGEQYVNEVAFEVDGAVTVNWDGVFRDRESTFQGVRLNADIRRGDSGTALFMSDRKVIGLIHSTSRNGVDRGYAVSSKQISDFLAATATDREVVAARCP